MTSRPITNPKLAFAAVLLGFQVQLLTPPALSSGHHTGGREIAQTPTEAQTQGAPEAGNPKDVSSEERLREEMEKIVKEAREKLKEVQDNARDSGAELTKIQGTASEVQTKASEVGAKLEEVQDNVRDSRTELTKIQGTASEVQTKASEVGAKLKEVQDNVRDSRTKLTEIQGTASEVQTKASEVESKFTEVKAGIENAIEPLKEEYEDLRLKISEVQGQIKSVAIFGSIAAALAAILITPLIRKILALAEFSPDRLEKHLKERIDMLERKIDDS